MSSFPSLVRSVSSSGESRYALGDPSVDRYLEFVAGRCRPNMLVATAFDLKVFFTILRSDEQDGRHDHLRTTRPTLLEGVDL